MAKVSNLSIIQMLRKNAKTPFREIADSFEVSDTAIRKRVKNLESKGVIRKYTIDVDSRKLGFQTALIGIDTEPESFISALDHLSELQELESVFSSTGDHMILIEYWFRTPQELSQFVRDLEQIDGVTKVCPAILLDKIK